MRRCLHVVGLPVSWRTHAAAVSPALPLAASLLGASWVSVPRTSGGTGRLGGTKGKTAEIPPQCFAGTAPECRPQSKCSKLSCTLYLIIFPGGLLLNSFLSGELASREPQTQQ